MTINNNNNKPKQMSRVVRSRISISNTKTKLSINFAEATLQQRVLSIGKATNLKLKLMFSCKHFMLLIN